MKMFNKKETETIGSSVKRIKTMETHALRSWFDSTLLGTGAAYDQWRYHDGPSSNVSEHLDALNELWKEIKHRDGI